LRKAPGSVTRARRPGACHPGMPPEPGTRARHLRKAPGNATRECHPEKASTKGTGASWLDKALGHATWTCEPGKWAGLASPAAAHRPPSSLMSHMQQDFRKDFTVVK